MGSRALLFLTFVLLLLLVGYCVFVGLLCVRARVLLFGLLESVLDCIYFIFGGRAGGGGVLLLLCVGFFVFFLFVVGFLYGYFVVIFSLFMCMLKSSNTTKQHCYSRSFQKT